MKILTQYAIENFINSLNFIFHNDTINHPLKRLVAEADSKDPSRPILKYPRKEGLLHEIGKLVFEHITFKDLPKQGSLNCYEETCFRLHDIISYSGIATDDAILNKSGSLAYYAGTMAFDDISNSYNEIVNSYKSSFPTEYERLITAYATDFSRRFFNDRQLCEELAHLVVLIFFEEGETEEIYHTDDFQYIRSFLPYKQVARKGGSYKLKWLYDALKLRENSKCVICGNKSPDLTIDHIIPLGLGGCSDIVNLQVTCMSCNNKKDDKLLDVSPSFPKYLSQLPLNYRSRTTVMAPSWVHPIDHAYRSLSQKQRDENS